MLTVAIIGLVLLGARIALPFIVKHQVNQRFAVIPGYWGHVEGIGVSLLRGAYTLDTVGIYRIEGAAREPFFRARHIDFSVAWRELFHRKIVSDILADGVELNVVAAASRAASQKDLDRRWQEVIRDIFPLEIAHLEITHGAVRYQDLTKTPHVDLFIKNMHVFATGLRNRSGERGDEFPAKINIEGDSLGAGKLALFVEADPLAPQPHFHLSVKVDHVNLPALNESLRAYANVDVRRGTFRMAAEMAGRDGGFQGYVKPFFENVDFNNLDENRKGVFSRVWENMVQGLAWLVKNKARDQVGTRIPFQGRFGDPQIGLAATIVNLFRHGFIRAFNPTVEGTVHAANVLPSGESADGKKVSEVKGDETDNRAGAPTGRPSAPPPKKK